MSDISAERKAEILELLEEDFQLTSGYEDGSNAFQNVIAVLPEYDAAATAAAGIPEHLDEYVLTDGSLLDLDADSRWRIRPKRAKAAKPSRYTFHLTYQDLASEDPDARRWTEVEAASVPSALVKFKRVMTEEGQHDINDLLVIEAQNMDIP